MDANVNTKTKTKTLRAEFFFQINKLLEQEIRFTK